MKNITMHSQPYNRGLFSGLLLLAIFLISAPSRANDHGQLNYRVERGDTLGNIGQRLLENVGDWREIRRINKLKNPNRIKPGSILRVPYKLLKQTPVAATVAFASGTVEQRRAGEPTNHPLKQGMSVNEGDQILTGQTGTATVDFLDGSQLVILRDSVVGFSQLKGRKESGVTSIQIELKQGRVETRVVPRKRAGSRYDIITPTVQIGVRGTEFRVNLNEANQITRTEVMHGVVAADNALGGVTVPQGFGTLIEKNQAPRAPVALLPAPIAPTFLMTPTSTTLHWPPLANAVAYRVVIAADSGFAKRVTDYTPNKPEIQLAPLPAGRYFIRVLGVDAIGLEGNASERSIDF